MPSPGDTAAAADAQLQKLGQLMTLGRRYGVQVSTMLTRAGELIANHEKVERDEQMSTADAVLMEALLLDHRNLDFQELTRKEIGVQTSSMDVNDFAASPEAAENSSFAEDEEADDARRQDTVARTIDSLFRQLDLMQQFVELDCGFLPDSTQQAALQAIARSQRLTKVVQSQLADDEQQLEALHLQIAELKLECSTLQKELEEGGGGGFGRSSSLRRMPTSP
eukprot:RCo020634